MEAMTLEQIKDWHLKRAGLESSEKTAGMHARMAKALSAHLDQPAQAVDVGAIQEVAGRLMDGNPYGMSRGVCRSLADRLTRALSVQKAGPVGDARPLSEYHEDHGPAVWWCWDSERGEWRGEPAWIGGPNDSDWPGYHTHWTRHPTFPASPTPDKEGA